MVPFDYAQRQLLIGWVHGTQPLFRSQPDALQRFGQPCSRRRRCHCFRHQVQWQHDIQRVASRAADKRCSHGLQYQVSYTFSKCMSDSTGYYGAWNNALSASAYWQNVYDQRSEWAPCYYDATNVLSAYAVYDLPFGRGKAVGKDVNGVVNQVIGGWAVSPIVSFRTGWPLPVQGAQDNSGTFGRGARANCNGVPSITNTPIEGIGSTVVHQYRTIHPASEGHLRQLLTSTR